MKKNITRILLISVSITAILIWAYVYMPQNGSLGAVRRLLFGPLICALSFESILLPSLYFSTEQNKVPVKIRAYGIISLVMAITALFWAVLGLADREIDMYDYPIFSYMLSNSGNIVLCLWWIMAAVVGFLYIQKKLRTRFQGREIICLIIFGIIALAFTALITMSVYFNQLSISLRAAVDIPNEVNYEDYVDSSTTNEKIYFSCPIEVNSPVKIDYSIIDSTLFDTREFVSMPHELFVCDLDESNIHMTAGYIAMDEFKEIQTNAEPAAGAKIDSNNTELALLLPLNDKGYDSTYELKLNYSWLGIFNREVVLLINSGSNK